MSATSDRIALLRCLLSRASSPYSRKQIEDRIAQLEASDTTGAQAAVHKQNVIDTIMSSQPKA